MAELATGTRYVLIYNSHHLEVRSNGQLSRIWAIELAESLPNSRVDGFDISDKQFPPKEWCPSNVTLKAHDSFDPFPEEYHGVYDVVNVRYFMSLLHNKERLHLFLRNVRSLLSMISLSPNPTIYLEHRVNDNNSSEPGGLFQWFDLNPRTARVISANASVITTATEKVATMIRSIPREIDM